MWRYSSAHAAIPSAGDRFLVVEKETKVIVNMPVMPSTSGNWSMWALSWMPPILNVACVLSEHYQLTAHPDAGAEWYKGTARVPEATGGGMKPLQVTRST